MIAHYRPYTPEDRASCIAVLRSNVPDWFAESDIDAFATFLEAPECEYIVIESDDACLACGGYDVRDGVGRLCWGMVHRAHHREGLGAALLELRVNALFEHYSVNRIAITTSQQAAGFFARYGFVVTGLRANGLAPGLDEVTMELPKAQWQERTAMTEAEPASERPESEPPEIVDHEP